MATPEQRRAAIHRAAHLVRTCPMFRRASAADLQKLKPKTFHTIPVPRGWSVEQAWEAISREVELTDPCPRWANIETEDGRFVRVLPLEDDESEACDARDR